MQHPPWPEDKVWPTDTEIMPQGWANTFKKWLLAIDNWDSLSTTSRGTRVACLRIPSKICSQGAIPEKLYHSVRSQMCPRSQWKLLSTSQVWALTDADVEEQLALITASRACHRADIGKKCSRWFRVTHRQSRKWPHRNENQSLTDFGSSVGKSRCCSKCERNCKENHRDNQSIDENDLGDEAGKPPEPSPRHISLYRHIVHGRASDKYASTEPEIDTCENMQTLRGTIVTTRGPRATATSGW